MVFTSRDQGDGALVLLICGIGVNAFVPLWGDRQNEGEKKGGEGARGDEQAKRARSHGVGILFQAEDFATFFS